MKIKASAGRARKADLRTHCESLDLRTTTMQEPDFLAFLYRVLSFGGCIKITLWDGTENISMYRDVFNDRKCGQCESRDVFPDTKEIAKCADCGHEMMIIEL